MRFQNTNPPLSYNLPPPVTSGGLQTYTDSSGILWIAKPGVYGGQWRNARDVLHCRMAINGSWSGAGTGDTNFPFDTIVSDPYGLGVLGANAYILAPVTGWYTAEFCAQFTNANVTLYRIFRNFFTSAVVSGQIQPATIINQAQNYNTTFQASANDHISYILRINAAGNLLTGVPYVNFGALHYQGTG